LRHRQRIFTALLAAAMTCVCGCGLSGWKMSTVSVTGMADAPAEASLIRDQERRFAAALELLRTGKEQEARDLLELVVAGPARSGVTDEALFRLSLLSLRDDGTKGSARTQDLLERLTKEFPGSLWTYQGAPIADYLTAVRTLRDRQREVKTLKELNLSLSRDNREMRQSIERLKSLDLELENKIKR
jgi:hypothetical protein